MILKIKIGQGFRGLDQYVSSKDGAIQLATNMGGQTPRERAAEIAGLRSARPDLTKAVGHLILSHSPDLPDLTPEEWRAAIEVARKEHDLRDAPFCSVLHADTDHRHVHLFFCASGPTAASYRTAKVLGPMSELHVESSVNSASHPHVRWPPKKRLATAKKPTTLAADQVENI